MPPDEVQSSSAPLISAVILTYNKRDYTHLCVEGLWRTAYRPLEIIVVDNGSVDGTAEEIVGWTAEAERHGVQLRYIQNMKNNGAPAGRNQGTEVARGRYLLFIDNDAVPFNENWLDEMVQALNTLPDAAVVSARLLYPFSPHLVQFAGCGISTSGRVQYMGRGAARDDPAFSGNREVQCLISACILCRADAVREVGGFDVAFSPVQYEDLDLCYRIRELGLRCYVVGTAEVFHFENTTTDGSSDINFRYVTIKNGMLFKERWKHHFTNEAGPSDADTRWAALEQKTLSQMGPGWTPWDDGNA